MENGRIDYGRMAYLKAEELEGQVRRLGSQGSEVGGSRGFFEVGRTLQGRLAICKITPSGGNACVIARIVASAEGRRGLDVLVEGCPSSRHIIEGQKKEYLVLMQARLGKAAELSLQGEGIWVESVELLLVGGRLSGKGNRLYGDASTDYAVVLCQRGDQILIFEGNESQLSFDLSNISTQGQALASGEELGQGGANGRLLAMGRGADVAYINGNFYIVLVDIEGNAWLKNHTKGSTYKLISEGCSAAAVTGQEGAIVVAVIKEGEAVIYTLDTFEAQPLYYNPQINHTLTALSLAKSTTPPILTAQTNNGASFFVVAEREKRTKESVKIQILA